VALSGDAAPEAGSNVNFSNFGFGFGAPVLNDSGQTAFRGFLTGSEVSFSNRSGIWSEGGSAGLALVARAGDVAPETGGANFSNFDSGFETPLLNNAGQTAFFGTIQQSTEVSNHNSSGVWLEGGGTGLALIARAGNVAPGTSGANFSYFGTPLLNNTGQLAFRGFLNTVGTGTGIWSGAGGSGLGLVTREGNLAPGTGGANFASNLNFSIPAFNDAGQTAFFARITAAITVASGRREAVPDWHWSSVREMWPPKLAALNFWAISVAELQLSMAQARRRSLGSSLARE